MTGASSGIGHALALELSRRGWQVGLIARRGDKLVELQTRLEGRPQIQISDFSTPGQALLDFQVLWDKLERVDLVILNAGTSLSGEAYDWRPDELTLAVNAASFTALANETAKRFIRQRAGYLAGISSIAGLRGSGRAPVYGATKAYISNYLEGLRQKVRSECRSVYITDIRPGFVDTALVQNVRQKFWAASPEKAAKQILRAIFLKKRRAYVTRRWTVLAWLYRICPAPILEFFYGKLFKKN